MYICKLTYSILCIFCIHYVYSTDRSPEVLLGVPYNGSIDMWSLACVCAEMYLGLPLFPGVSQHNQLTRIIEMFGAPPDYLVDGKNGLKYFTYVGNTPSVPSTPRTGGQDDEDFDLSSKQIAQHRGLKVNTNPTTSTSLETTSSTSGIDANSGHTTAAATIATHTKSVTTTATTSNTNSDTTIKQSKYRLKTAEEYARETKTEVPMLRKYLRYNRLEDVILKYPLANRSKLTNEQKRDEILRRHCFLNFLQGLFNIDPFHRWTAKQAASHPFITNLPYTGSFTPIIDNKINDRKLAYLLQIQNRHDAKRINSNSINSTGRTLSSPYSVIKSMYARPSPPPINSTAAISNILSMNTQTEAKHVFPALERRQTEPVLSQRHSDMMKIVEDEDQEEADRKMAYSKQSSLSANGIEHLAAFANRPMLQRGKPVVPEKFSEGGSDSGRATTHLSDGSISDTSVVIIQPNKLGSNANGPSKHTARLSGDTSNAYTPTDSSMDINMLRYQQQQLLQQQQYRDAHHEDYASRSLPPLSYQQQALYMQQQQQHQQQQQVYAQYASSMPHSQLPPPPPPALTRHISWQNNTKGLPPQGYPYQSQSNKGLSEHRNTPPDLQNLQKTQSHASLDEMSPSLMYVGSMPSSTQAPPSISDFGQALLRPDMDEKRHFHSQQQYATYAQQQQQMLQQQQLQQQMMSNNLNTSAHGRDRRFSGAAATAMMSSPVSASRQKMTARSYENKPRNFLSSVMGTFRSSNRNQGNSGGGGGGQRYDDELNQSRHGDRDRGMYGGAYEVNAGELGSAFSPLSTRNSIDEGDKFDKHLGGSMHSVASDRDRYLNMSAHSDRYLNASTHSISSVGSDYPIMNRNDMMLEVERQRHGDREGFMRQQLSEVELAQYQYQQQQQQMWQLNAYGAQNRGNLNNSTANGRGYGLNSNNLQYIQQQQQQQLQQQQMLQQQQQMQLQQQHSQQLGSFQGSYHLQPPLSQSLSQHNYAVMNGIAASSSGAYPIQSTVPFSSSASSGSHLSPTAIAASHSNGAYPGKLPGSRQSPTQPTSNQPNSTGQSLDVHPMDTQTTSNAMVLSHSSNTSPQPHNPISPAHDPDSDPFFASDII